MTLQTNLVQSIEYIEKTRELLKDNPYQKYVDLHLNTVYWELKRQLTNLNVTD